MTIKYNKLAGIVKILLDLLFIIGIMALVALPIFRNANIDLYRSTATEYLIKNIFWVLFFTDLAIVYVLYELRKIFKTVKAGQPFVEANVKSLFRMGVASFLCSLVFIIKLFVFKTILTYAMILVLIIAGCFSWTLSALFNEAKRVKEENDLTI